MCLQRGPTSTVTGLGGEELIVHVSFPIKGLLEVFQVTQSLVIKGKVIQGAMIALNMGLVGWAARPDELMLDPQSSQP